MSSPRVVSHLQAVPRCKKASQVTTYNLRPDFRNAFGPGDFVMPVDAAPAPHTDFEMADALGLLAFHEDSEDRHNEDGTWGADPWGYGGSGVALGYSSDDLGAVIVAERGCYKRPVRYNLAHWIRQIRYAIAAWEMTHDTKFARRIVEYDLAATAQMTDDPGTIHLGDPGWIPQTLAQYHAMAQAEPGTGIPAELRQLAWVGYGNLMRLKVDRKASRAWITMLLETCDLAAHAGTGQIGRGLTSTFHEALLLHTVLCACHRISRPPPPWAIDLMRTIEFLPRMDYYGLLSPVRFWSTVGGLALPAARPNQQGDPGFAYWSSNCVALHKLEPSHGWLERGYGIGPTQAVDQNSRMLTMLLRGATTG